MPIVVDTRSVEYFFHYDEMESCCCKQRKRGGESSVKKERLEAVIGLMSAFKIS